VKFSLPKIATAPFCPPEVAGSVSVDPRASLFKRLLRFAGPGLLISIGYMDPGNWATAIEAGSRYGYNLLFVVLLIGVVLLVGLLNYVPALALGPVVEHLMLWK